MYSTSFRHSVSVVQKPSSVAARLLSYTPARVKIGKADSFGGVEIPGLPPKGNASKSTETSAGTSETTSASPLDQTVVNDKVDIRKLAKHLNGYKAGQSPATLHPNRYRAVKPGLSWLGDDEFESTGLAFKLLSRHTQPSVTIKPTGGPGPRKNANKNAGPGSGPRSNDRKQRTRVGASGNAGKEASQPEKVLAQKPRSKRVDATKTEVPKAVRPGVYTGPATSSPTLKSPPAPVHVNLGSTDFTSLFGASPSFSASPSSPSTKTIPTDTASLRVQLALEQHGGDYSNLVSSSLVTSGGSPVVYAESTMARRRDLGPGKRDTALRIIQGMVDKSQGSQPTA